MKNQITLYTKKEFVTKYDPIKMIMDYRHVNSIEKALKEDSTGISVYIKEIGFDSVQAIIELHLVALNQTVNVSNPLTVLQIKEISIEILSTFYYLSIVEISFVLRKAKRGDYGKMYNSLNMPDILLWFSSYSEDRIKYFMDESIKNIHNDDSLRSEDRKILERHNKLNPND